MPLHAQIACIGGNAFFAFLFVLAAGQQMTIHDTGMAIFMIVLAGAAAYTCRVLFKFRRYLSIEASIARELQMERLEAEIAALKAGKPI